MLNKYLNDNILQSPVMQTLSLNIPFGESTTLNKLDTTNKGFLRRLCSYGDESTLQMGCSKRDDRVIYVVKTGDKEVCSGTAYLLGLHGMFKMEDTSDEKNDASDEKNDASDEKSDASDEKSDASDEKSDASDEKSDASASNAGDDNDMRYYWSWPSTLDSESTVMKFFESNSKFVDAIAESDDEIIKNISKHSLAFLMDPMIISYIQAKLLEHFELEFIYNMDLSFNGDDATDVNGVVFASIGIKDVKWAVATEPVIEAVDETDYAELVD